MDLTREEFLERYWNTVKRICTYYNVPFNKAIGNNAYLCQKGIYNPTIIKERQIAKNLGLTYFEFLEDLNEFWRGLEA
ncbi:hypothetical protein [Enterococcus phage vB_EfaP_Ef6.2]|uniref:Uncharacterized protein n=2 Tax=Copernicusvirus TaxID=2842616 RepID=A0A4D6DS50_9CAUD|nr:hypothetical protein H3T65_gp13 [Enterococcus phage vB_EfaP_Ef6.2]YP_009908847.1 hypothetical protein H3T66_gp12 [Enterococcus phage vB_EfaP_Ef6.3]QBZ69185.1 hypothetical protein [Enterococcus phage vB_EfaP_Ef6.2]QBZ69532.1 hypothetical protein [Enterococcus phage vB_EfaP_Ef6.3]